MPQIHRVLAAALLLSAAATLHANEHRYERAVNKTVRYQGGKVTIDNSFGAVEVHEGEAGEVTIHAVVRASTEELQNAIKVEISATPAGVTIRSDFPEQIRNASFSVSYDVAIPITAPLLVKNRFGSTTVTGTRAPVEVVSRQGSVTLHDVLGAQKVDNA